MTAHQKKALYLIGIGLAVLFFIRILSHTYLAVGREFPIPTHLRVEPSAAGGIPVRIDLYDMGAYSDNVPNNSACSGSFQLYLPGNAEPAGCFLSWDGDFQASVDGCTYDSGACPIPPVNMEKTYTFKAGFRNSVSYRIITYRGSADVQPVFIEIDESIENNTISQMDNDSAHKAKCTGRISIAGRWYEMSIKGRGNQTWKYADDKRPYAVTLQDKIVFPGVDSPVTDKWTFLAEVLDHSLLRNRVGLYLAHELGIGYDTTSADVWMNGEYQGCYTVTPKTDAFVPRDGYLVEEDNYLEPSLEKGGDPQFCLEGLEESSGSSSSYNRITVKKVGADLLLKDGIIDESPDSIESAVSEIRVWLQEAWDAMRSADGLNHKTGKYYADYIDMESFAKMYLLQEYIKSYDVCAGSIFFHRDGMTDVDKLAAGPLWDLDSALGSTIQNSKLGEADNRKDGDRRSGEGDFIPNITEYKTSIFKTLGGHEDFMEEVEYQYKKYEWVFNSMGDVVADLICEIEDSARMNHIKVNEIREGKNNQRYDADTVLGSGPYKQKYYSTYDSRYDWNIYAENLKTYVVTRSLWFKNKYHNQE